MKKQRRAIPYGKLFLLSGVLITIFVILGWFLLPSSWLRFGCYWIRGRMDRQSVESRLAQFSSAAKARLKIRDLPERLDLVVFKREKILEVWGIDHAKGKHLLGTYPILAASGTDGPKLREGDRQVPEGIYEIESLHPNSHFYLALRIAYPSREDVQIARLEHRNPATLGSDIMLHGRGGSIGCIAVADETMEEIFYLTANIGVEKTRILLCPYDFRNLKSREPVVPAWLEARYCQLAEELTR